MSERTGVDPGTQSLRGKRAIVTGAAQGVGAVTARRIVELGGRVVLADVNRDKVHETAGSLGEAASAVTLDVADAASWDDAITAWLDAAATFGWVPAVIGASKDGWSGRRPGALSTPRATAARSLAASATWTSFRPTSGRASSV